MFQPTYLSLREMPNFVCPALQITRGRAVYVFFFHMFVIAELVLKLLTFSLQISSLESKVKYVLRTVQSCEVF